MPQEHLAALGAQQDRISTRFIPTSRATIHRVMVQAGSDEVQAAANRWAQARPVPDRSALAADGKRINGVNRSGTVHHETATLVVHAEGVPIACRVCHEEGGEKAAALAVLEDVEIRGAVITVDALHTSRNTADAIVRTHGAHYLFTAKGNAPETFETRKATNWERDTQRRFTDVQEKPLYGRRDTHSIECVSPLDNLFTIPHVQQMFRVTRERKHVRSGDTAIEHANGITSLSHAEASPDHLLSLNRGHWAMENRNHRRRDTTFRKDACLMRTGHGPANNTAFSNLALAIILTAGFDCVPAVTGHFEWNRDDALKHVPVRRPRMARPHPGKPLPGTALRREPPTVSHFLPNPRRCASNPAQRPLRSTRDRRQTGNAPLNAFQGATPLNAHSDQLAIGDKPETLHSTPFRARTEPTARE